MVDLSSIEQADVLRGLTKADLAELGTIASEQPFNRKDCLFRRGEAAKTFYIALRGRYALTLGLRVFDRLAEVAVEEKGACDAFGWSSLVEPRESLYSGYCTEDGVVVAFPREQLEALMRTNTRLGEEFLHNLNVLIGTRLRAMQQLWLDEVSQSTARVQHWSHSELTTHWTEAMTEPSHGFMRRFSRRSTHVGTSN